MGICARLSLQPSSVQPPWVEMPQVPSAEFCACGKGTGVLTLQEEEGLLACMGERHFGTRGREMRGKTHGLDVLASAALMFVLFSELYMHK